MGNFSTLGKTLSLPTNIRLSWSFQLYKWPCICHAATMILSKKAKLKVENLGQTTFRFTPVRTLSPVFNMICSKKYVWHRILLFQTLSLNFESLPTNIRLSWSFQLYKWPCICHAATMILSKKAKLKVENLGQTTFRFTPIRMLSPVF